MTLPLLWPATVEPSHCGNVCGNPRVLTGQEIGQVNHLSDSAHTSECEFQGQQRKGYAPYCGFHPVRHRGSNLVYDGNQGQNEGKSKF